MAPVQLILETGTGGVVVRRYFTRIEAVLALQNAMDEPTYCRLTIHEDGAPVYSIRRTAAGWREDSFD